MKKHVCDVCGYIYDEEIGDPDDEPGTNRRADDLSARCAEWE